MRLDLPIGGAEVRPWRENDLQTLVRLANDLDVSRQLRDRFPHPYETAHGHGFLHWVAQQPVESVWAIALDGSVVGGIGLELGQDVERVSAEIGYWLGRPFWGRGLATAALRAVTAHAFAHFDVTRIFAVPFDSNLASIRVLEKAGYVLEGRLRQSAIKYGEVLDQRIYAAYRPEK
jgi:RimJ/RimL family protein N-acetyltransferase